MSGRGTGWKLLRAPARANRTQFLRLAGWSLLEAAPIMVSGQLVAMAVDRGFLAGDLAVGIGLLSVYGMTMILGAIGTRQSMTPLAMIVESIRDHVVRQVVTAGLATAVRANTQPNASLLTRINRQAEMVRQMSGALLTTVRSVLFSALAVVIGLLTLLPLLAWLTLGALAVSATLLVLLTRVLRRRLEHAMIAEEKLSETTGRILTGIRDVRACGAIDTAEREVAAAIDVQAAASMSSAKVGAWRVAVIAVGARLPLMLALIAAPSLVRSGAATPGEILGAGTYLVSGLEPVLRQIVHTVGNMGLQLSVVLSRLALHTVLPEEPEHGTRLADRLDIRLDGVSFAYGPHSEPIVRDFCLHVEPGEHLVVVGPSGIGKSTVANLIAGIETPQRGTVSLGGVSLADLDPSWVQRNIAFVPQEHYVFAGTLRENLNYLAPASTDADLHAVVGLFGLRDTTSRIGGLDADLGHIDSLSQGERQLITLARVYLSPARIVLLDEASCNLDPVAEELVENAFIRRGNTLVVVAHRVSSAMRAPRILVMDGSTAEIGDHETLLRTSALYADLIGTSAKSLPRSDLSQAS